jgi:plastocyanin
VPRISALSLVAVALTVGLAACGGSSSSSSTSSSSAPASSSSSSTSSSASGSAGGGSTVKEAADPSGQLKFTNNTLTAKAGKATVDFTNASPVPHNMTIVDSSGKKVGATPTFSGGTKSFTADLKPGKYTFYCSVPGHRQAGMQGTLTVS